MKKTTIIAIVLSIVVIGVVAGFYHESIAQVIMGREGKTAATDKRISPKPEKLVLPKLTEAEKQRAIEIALGDPRIQELLEGKKYEVAPEDLGGPSIGPMGVMTEHGWKKLGAALDIRFDRTYLIEYDWLHYEPTDREMTSFEEKPIRASGKVRTLKITVHFESGRVVMIAPSSR